MCMRTNKYLDFDLMMNFKNETVQGDLCEIASRPLPWESLAGKSCLVMGADGMIATNLVYTLMHLARKHGLDIRVAALSRNRERRKAFTPISLPTHTSRCLCKTCATRLLIKLNGGWGYIFHFAGNASPYFIKHDPVGIMRSNLFGTMNVLDLANRCKADRVVFAST